MVQDGKTASSEKIMGLAAQGYLDHYFKTIKHFQLPDDLLYRHDARDGSTEDGGGVGPHEDYNVTLSAVMYFFF